MMFRMKQEKTLSFMKNDVRLIGFSSIEKYENEGKTPLQITFSFGTLFQEECVVVMIKDLKKYEQLRTLQKQNKYTTIMFAQLSHELRTPLNSSITLLTCAKQDQTISEDFKNQFIVPALQC